MDIEFNLNHSVILFTICQQKTLFAFDDERVKFLNAKDSSFVSSRVCPNWIIFEAFSIVVSNNFLAQDLFSFFTLGSILQNYIATPM